MPLPLSNAPFSHAAERNQQPILELLLQLLPDRGAALEIASGTGQHVIRFAAALPAWTWQPTDVDGTAFPAIRSRIVEAGLGNVHDPVLLDVTASGWPLHGPAFRKSFDAIFCANMLHIAPWSACAGLMQGAARYLAPSGVLLTYGPYLESGTPTAASNLDFDQSLRERNAHWGIRHLEEVTSEAGRVGLRLQSRHSMPANNLLLVFVRIPNHGPPPELPGGPDP